MAEVPAIGERAGCRGNLEAGEGREILMPAQKPHPCLALYVQRTVYPLDTTPFAKVHPCTYAHFLKRHSNKHVCRAIDKPMTQWRVYMGEENQAPSAHQAWEDRVNRPHP